MKTFLTYDYELFMGDVCGSIQNCLISPVTEITNILQRYHIKATFFVDAAFLYRMNVLRDQFKALESQWELLVENISWLESEGHDVELHIHPQWYYSSYNGIHWKMDLEHFKLSDMPRDDVDSLVSQSQTLLESIIGRKTCAFRACGYSIQDLESYRDFFINHHIKVDSTVLSGLKFHSENQAYDYSAVTGNKPYFFNEDITHELENGDILEVPITTFYVSKIQYLEHLLFQKRKASVLKRSGDGRAIVPANNSLSIRAKRVLGRDNYMSASFDDANGRWINLIFDSQLKDGKDMVVISHPKLHTRYSSDKMIDFIEHSLDKSEFSTMYQLIEHKACNFIK